MENRQSNTTEQLDLHERRASNRNHPQYNQKITLELGELVRFLACNTVHVIGETLDFAAFLSNKANQKAELDVQMLRELFFGLELDPKTIEKLRVEEDAKIRAKEKKAKDEAQCQKTLEGYKKIFEIREAHGGRYVQPKEIKK